MNTQVSKRTMKRANTKASQAQAATEALSEAENTASQQAASPDAAFLKEVQSDLALARATALWERFKLPFIGAVALLFIAVGGTQWWQAKSAETQTAQAELYFAAQQGDEAAKATLLAEGAPLYQFLLGNAEADLPETLQAFTQTAGADDVASLRGLDTPENAYQVLALLRLMHAADAGGDAQAANAYRQRLLDHPQTPQNIRQLAQVQLGLQGIAQ